MRLFLDESGSFTPAGHCEPRSWCVVGAYVTTTEDRAASACLSRLKERLSHPSHVEVKLKHVDEARLTRFLDELVDANGVFFATAVDMSTHTAEMIRDHQRKQCQVFIENLGGRAMGTIANQFVCLSEQLYMQALVEFQLIRLSISQAINYFGLRAPSELNKFEWLVDQKHEGSAFDASVRHFAPEFCRLMSARSPAEINRDVPQEHYQSLLLNHTASRGKIDSLAGGYLELDLKKILMGSFKFVDSKVSDGNQVVDLLVSSLRRCLRDEFYDSLGIAERIGALMVELPCSHAGMELVSLADAEKAMNIAVAGTLLAIGDRCRLMRPGAARGVEW